MAPFSYLHDQAILWLLTAKPCPGRDDRHGCRPEGKLGQSLAVSSSVNNSPFDRVPFLVLLSGSFFAGTQGLSSVPSHPRPRGTAQLRLPSAAVGRSPTQPCRWSCGCRTGLDYVFRAHSAAENRRDGHDKQRQPQLASPST